jgi:fructose-1,6-bisphosphatase/inositol monophosphatase family enzyme
MSTGADRFLEVFRVAAWQAGAVARRLQGEVLAGTKPGQTSEEAAAVSVADLATQDVLLLALREYLPGVAVDAEEDSELAAEMPRERAGEPLVVVDPIDGTWNYLRGSPDYAVMGGWIEGRRYTAALVHFPVWGETYWGRLGQAAWRQVGDGVPQQARAGGGDPRMLVPPGLPEEIWRSLATTGLELQVSRCSAVDGAAPIAARAVASVAWGHPGRRRAVALAVALAGGATVTIGGEPWVGEDPVAQDVGRGPTVVAADPARARELVRLFGVGEQRDREDVR